MKTEIYYLGYCISQEGIKSDHLRTQNLFKKELSNKKALSRILGLIQWFRPFIKYSRL